MGTFSEHHYLNLTSALYGAPGSLPLGRMTVISVRECPPDTMPIPTPVSQLVTPSGGDILVTCLLEQMLTWQHCLVPATTGLMALLRSGTPMPE